MNEYFYNFTTDGINLGYSYLRFDHTHLKSYTRFRLEGAELYTNIFLLKLDEEKVLACKHNSRDWVDLRHQPPRFYPSCAYPLFLSKVTSAPYRYTQISEDDGSPLGEVVLSWAGDDIVETQNAAVRRRFTMQDDVPVRIDWGGTISHLCQTAEEAIAGSGLEFVDPSSI